MPVPIDACRDCGSPIEGWTKMNLRDFERLGASMDVRDGLDALTWIDRYDVYICGSGQHLTKTRR